MEIGRILRVFRHNEVKYSKTNDILDDSDYNAADTITFNKAVIYNDRESSGNLNLVINIGTLSQLSKYPLTNKDNTQDILITHHNGKFTFNHFYNRRLSDKNNIPMFNWDYNMINKTVNDQAVSFYGKNVLEQLSSDTQLIQLTYDQDSRYDISLQWAVQSEILDY